jgi:hypothetical protein
MVQRRLFCSPFSLPPVSIAGGVNLVTTQKYPLPILSPSFKNALFPSVQKECLSLSYALGRSFRSTSEKCGAMVLMNFST